MSRNVIFAGFLGGVVLMVLTFVINGIFGFRAGIDMKQIPDERLVYETLKEHIVDPGRYACNPALTPDRRFPGGEPVFSVLYGGVGHEAAGRLEIFGLVLAFLASMIAAWMMSQMSERILSSYLRKVLFYMAIGLLIAVFIDLANSGIGDYPLKDAFKLAANHVALWTLTGLAVAPIIRIKKAAAREEASRS